MKKLCKACKKEKTNDEFYKHHGDILQSICKECVKKRVHEYWESGRGKEIDKKRQKNPVRKKWMKVYSQKMYEKHWKQRAARTKFWNEFRHGTIKKLPCEVCGTEDLVEAHHSDYDKPLQVVWMCSFHHKEWHRDNDSLNQA